jgi:hypothetical protein
MWLFLIALLAAILAVLILLIFYVSPNLRTPKKCTTGATGSTGATGPTGPEEGIYDTQAEEVASPSPYGDRGYHGAVPIGQDPSMASIAESPPPSD